MRGPVARPSPDARYAGGDGETAVRLARATQGRCKEFTVIIPDQAKRADTILALGAHYILMGPVGDLGRPSIDSKGCPLSQRPCYQS